jgi:hypothetical protein
VLPASSWVLPASASAAAESAPPLEDPPLEDPPLDELPPEDPLLEEPPLEEPLFAELPLEEPLLPAEVPFGAAPSFDSSGFEALGDVGAHAATRGAVTSAKPQRRTDRAFMFAGNAIPMPCSIKPEMPDDLGFSSMGAACYVAPAPLQNTPATPAPPSARYGCTQALPAALSFFGAVKNRTAPAAARTPPAMKETVDTPPSVLYELRDDW